MVSGLFCQYRIEYGQLIGEYDDTGTLIQEHVWFDVDHSRRIKKLEKRLTELKRWAKDMGCDPNC